MTHVPKCRICGHEIDPPERAAIKPICLECGEEAAKQVRHTIVPMAKSNYVVVTDRSLLKGLNKYANS
jgi:hypothetical protein